MAGSIFKSTKGSGGKSSGSGGAMVGKGGKPTVSGGLKGTKSTKTHGAMK